jgi:parallel beta-helix repeat protein
MKRIKRAAEYYPQWESEIDPDGPAKYGAGKVNAYRSITEWGHVTTDSDHIAYWGAQTGSPDTYYVSGDLVVEEGDTLVLNKGTTIKIAPEPWENDEINGEDPNRVEIIVKGTLRAGTSGSGPIVFESFADTPAIGDWAGIRFDSPSNGYALEGITVRHAKIGIEVVSGELLLKDNVVDSCETGIKISSANVTVDTCTVQNNTDYGIYAVSSDSLLTIKRSIVKFNDVGMYLADSTQTTVTSCTVTDNDIGIEVYRDHLVTIKNCTINDNTTDGIYIHSGSPIKIEGNTVDGNGVGIFAYSANVKIKNSNVVTNNTGGIKCDYFAHALIESTTISGNGTGILAVNGSEPGVGGGTGSGDNSITNQTYFHISNLTTEVTIMAENNWWGSSRGPKATEFIGPVDYTPWRSSAPSLTSEFIAFEDEEDGEELPHGFAISAAYPNPFNPTATVKYEVPRPGAQVSLTIYNVRGQVVRTLVDEFKVPGFYTVTWDTRNDAGGPTASGIYFLQMRTRGFTQTKKLVLLK